MPSVVEGMPNGVLEAMASGLPVIASRVPGTEEVIEHGETGLLFEPGAVAELAATLHLLHRDPDLRHRLADRARAVSLDRSWEQVARQYAKIYARLVSSPLCKTRASYVTAEAGTPAHHSET